MREVALSVKVALSNYYLFLFFFKKKMRIQKTNKQGYGYLAKPARILAKDSDSITMVKLLLQKTSWIFAEVNDHLEDTIVQLPTFIQAFAHILREFGALLGTDDILSALYRVTGLMLVNYRQTGRNPRLAIYNSVAQLLVVLFRLTPGSLAAFLDRFIYDTLVLTCTDTQLQQRQFSAPMTAEGELDEDAVAIEASSHAYQDFKELWAKLFDLYYAREAGLKGFHLGSWGFAFSN